MAHDSEIGLASQGPQEWDEDKWAEMSPEDRDRIMVENATWLCTHYPSYFDDWTPEAIQEDAKRFPEFRVIQDFLRLRDHVKAVVSRGRNRGDQNT